MLRHFDALLEVLVYSVKTFVWFWHIVLTAFPRTEAFLSYDATWKMVYKFTCPGSILGDRIQGDSRDSRGF